MFLFEQSAEFFEAQSLRFDTRCFFDELVCPESSMTIGTLRHRIFEVLDVTRGGKDLVWSDNGSGDFDETMLSEEVVAPSVFYLSLESDTERSEVEEAA